MLAKQLSVFIENREGRLEQVTEILKEQDVNILSLSMADTMEYDMLRMIASDPDEARAALKEKEFSAVLTDVLAVKLEDQMDELHKMAHILCSQGLNIEYMYALASVSRKAMIVKTFNGETATRAVTDGGLVLYNNKEICW